MDRILGLCIVLLALAYLVAASQLPGVRIGDPMGPRLFPYIVGALMLPTGAALLLSRGAAEAQDARPLFADLRANALGFAGILGWSALYFATFEPLGYRLTTLIYLFVLLTFMYPRHHLTNIVIALGYVVCSSLMFGALGIRLPALL